MKIRTLIVYQRFNGTFATSQLLNCSDTSENLKTLEAGAFEKEGQNKQLVQTYTSLFEQKILNCYTA
jgi:hypothetical protein